MKWEIRKVWHMSWSPSVSLRELSTRQPTHLTAEESVAHKSKLNVCVVVWMRNTPPKFRYLDTWSPAGGTVWGNYGITRRQSLV